MNIDCPNCDNTLIAPPEVVGKKVQCTLCSHVFVAPAPIPVDNLSDDDFSSWLEEDYEESVQQEIQAHEQHERKLREMKSFKKSQAEKALTEKQKAEVTNKKRYVPFKNAPTAETAAEVEPDITADEDFSSISTLEDTNIDDLEISFIDEEADRKKRKEARLKKRQSKQHNPQLAEACLAHIKKWAHLASDDAILHYIPDADITHAEQGAAGIVFTAEQLHYKKYNYQGSVDLIDAQATIQAKQESDAFSLSLFKGAARARMVRLTPPAMDELKAHLKDASIKLKLK